MLDQIAFPDAAGPGVGQQLADHVQLVEAGKDLSPLLSSLGVLLLDDLGVILQDVGQLAFGQHVLPQVVRRDAVRVGRLPAPSFQP